MWACLCVEVEGVSLEPVGRRASLKTTFIHVKLTLIYNTDGPDKCEERDGG